MFIYKQDEDEDDDAEPKLSNVVISTKNPSLMRKWEKRKRLASGKSNSTKTGDDKAQVQTYLKSLTKKFHKEQHVMEPTLKECHDHSDSDEPKITMQEKIKSVMGTYKSTIMSCEGERESGSTHEEH